MTENQDRVEALPEGAPVRYNGSLAEFRGLTGSVAASYEMRGQTVYTVLLDLPGAGVQDLHCVRRQSIVVEE